MVNHFEAYPYVAALYDLDCRTMEEGIAAIESQVEFGLDPTTDTWPVTVTGEPGDVLHDATFQRAVGYVAQIRLNRAPREEAFIVELEALSDRAMELANH